jgi:hypothetical protein
MTTSAVTMPKLSEEFLKLDRGPLGRSHKLAFSPVPLKLFEKCWPTSMAMDWSRDSVP